MFGIMIHSLAVNNFMAPALLFLLAFLNNIWIYEQISPSPKEINSLKEELKKFHETVFQLENLSSEN